MLERNGSNSGAGCWSPRIFGAMSRRVLSDRYQLLARLLRGYGSERNGSNSEAAFW